MNPLRWRRLGLVLLGCGLLAAVLVVLASALVSRGATLAQRVEPQAGAAASLFGESSGPGTPIGSPQVLIIRDAQAFLPGRSAEGARYVNERYLRERNLYPLQLKTVLFGRDVALAAALALALGGGAAWWWARRRAGQGTAARQPNPP